MVAKKSGLGKGLAALLREGPAVGAEREGEIRQVPVDVIRSSPWQPRRGFSEESLNELADSIRQRGILQPLLVRQVDQAYELIAGERRLRAARLAGLREVPVRVVEADDTTAMELALIENLQREDLNPIEEAEGYRTLIERHGLTQEEVAQRVGRARATVANALRLLSLPEEVREWIAQGRISAGHAKALLSLRTAQEQLSVAERILQEDLSVREVERLVGLGAQPRRSRVRAEGVPEIPESYVRDLTERLQRKFGTTVRLTMPRVLPNGRRTRGELVMEFFSTDDLDRLMVLMGVSEEGF